MEKIKIITDSTCDLSRQIIEKYELEVVPLIVNFGEDSYLDGVDIDIREFLKKIKEGDIFPTTSGVNPHRFYEIYKEYLDKGYKIISIHLSSKMSGTYQAACMAKEMLETEDIAVIDSNNVTAGLGLLAIKAAQMKNEGYILKQIEEKILEIIPHVKTAYAFASLDNLVKGGRLSKAAGAIGSLLNIRLILAVVDGNMAVLDKVRGTKKAIKTILNYIDENALDEKENTIVLHIDNEDILPTLKEELSGRKVNYFECEVGCVVGTHSGPNACGIAYIEKYI